MEEKNKNINGTLEKQAIENISKPQIEYRYIEKDEHLNVGGIFGFVLSVVGSAVAIIAIIAIGLAGDGSDTIFSFSSVLLLLGLIFSFINCFFKPKTLAASGVIISLMTFLFMIVFLFLYGELDYITNYINDLQRIPLFNPNGEY